MEGKKEIYDLILKFHRRRRVHRVFLHVNISNMSSPFIKLFVKYFSALTRLSLRINPISVSYMNTLKKKRISALIEIIVLQY